MPSFVLHLLFVTLLSSIVTVQCGLNSSTTVTLANGTEITVVDLVRRMQRDIMTFWVSHGRDTPYGGFHASLDRRGRPMPPTKKSLIQHARHLWAFSFPALTSSLPSSGPNSARMIADNAYAFMRTHMLDPKDGRWVFEVLRNGSNLTPNSGEQLWPAWQRYSGCQDFRGCIIRQGLHCMVSLEQDINWYS